MVTPLLPAALSTGRDSGMAMKKERCLKEEREVFERDKGLAEAWVLPVILL